MLQKLTLGILWLSACIVSLIPGVIAFDNGGVLPWSFWAMSVAMILPSFTGFLAYRQDAFPSGILPHLLAIVLLFLGTYSLLQAVSLPASIVGALSPGSYAAWTDWQAGASVIAPEISAQGRAAISVAPEYSVSSAAKFFLMAAFAWCGTMLFSNRNAILLLLLLPSLIGAIHAILGLYQVFLFPEYTFWGNQANHPFGVFVNRNNASMLLNLSLACSLGLLGWRLAVVTGFEFGQRGFSVAVLLDLLSDKVSLFAFICAGSNLMGILFCGSRGGLAGAICGVVLSFGLLSHKPIYIKLLTGSLIALVVGLVLLAQVDVTPRTLERFGASAEGLSQSIASNQRLDHWRDTLTAIPNYAITGSGFGTYRYAHLPYQELGVGWWFVNADNLWLEWSLEGGLPVMLLLLTVVVVLIACLFRLHDTPDPIDHGIVTTGWFSLAAILVSQCFDFGLLLAGSAGLACLIFGAVLGRAAMDGMSVKFGSAPPSNRLVFKSVSHNYFGLLTGICVIGGVVFATNRLYQEAVVNSVVRSAKSKANLFGGGEEDDLIAGMQLLTSLPIKTSEELNTHAEIKAHLLAKELQATGRQLGLLDGNYELQGLKPFHWLRNLQGQVGQELPPGVSRDEFTEKLNEINRLLQPKIDELHRELAASLNISPLDPVPRFLYVLTTLTPDGHEQIEQQLLSLRGYATESLETLAQYATFNENWDLATICWQRLAANAPHRIEEFLRKAERTGHPNPISLVPESTEAIARAAAFRLDEGFVDEDFLANSIDLLTIQLPDSRGYRTERYLLLARIKAALDDFEAADKYYKDAIEASPTLLEARLSYMVSMINRGDLISAKRYASAMKEQFGDNNYRLNQVLAQIDSQLEERAQIDRQIDQGN